MAIKDIIGEIEKEVIDVTKTNFIHNDTTIVPGIEDGQLTYENGKDKRGKKIQTCVLYVDIRNSVALTEKHHTQTMGRIYTAFTKAVLKIARHHGGHTRNIIGDRVMIVFPSNDCFTRAVDCAISINHIAKYVINKQFTGVDFKCGIGIDFGELRVIKVGIQRYGTENGENKGLVWVGYPANIASRLTDIANKNIEEIYFEVVKNPINSQHLLNLLGTFSPKNPLPKVQYLPYAPLYSTAEETIEMTTEEFISKIGNYKDKELSISGGGRLVRFTKKARKIEYFPILMTEIVYKGFKNANPERSSVKNGYWKEQNHKIKNVSGKVYGGDVHWQIN